MAVVGVSRRKFLGCLAAGAAAPLAGCSPLALINGWVPSDTYRAKTGVIYGPEARHRLDTYSPTSGGTSGTVVVFFHGGGWNSGSRTDYLFVGEALAAKGCVAVLPDYRLYPEVRFPAFLDDCALAMRWTLDNISAAGGDPQRVFLMGHSAGAYNAAMLALAPAYLNAVGVDPGRLRGLIGLAGPYDFLPLTGTVAKAVFGFPDTPITTQPIHFATSAAPPALLATGGKDNVVDPGNSSRLAARLRAQGGGAREIVYPDLSHSTLIGALAAPFRRWAPVLDDIAAFVIT
jgi:acetyl esterase/lipase